MEDMLALCNDTRFCLQWVQADSANIFFAVYALEAVYVCLLRKP
jgi:hypothetical protein